MVLARQRLRVNEAIVQTELDDESVLLNVETGLYFGLNALGSDIWRALARGADEPGIVASIVADYDAPWETVTADVAAFVNQLVARGLIGLVNE